MTIDDDMHAEWLAEKYSVFGLVGLVNVKGFSPNYGELLATLDNAKIDHGWKLPQPRGLGCHIEEIFRRACDGETSTDIAAALGVKTKTLSRFCLRHGIELRQRLTLRDLDDELRQLVSEGLTAPNVAKHFGCSDVAIRKYCAANGIELPRGKPGFFYQSGYKFVRAPDHPQADSKGYVREHRLAKETVLGRALQRSEVVHHKDGDKLNNAPDNLDIMSLSEHASHHARNGDTGWQVHHRRRDKKI